MRQTGDKMQAKNTQIFLNEISLLENTKAYIDFVKKERNSYQISWQKWWENLLSIMQITQEEAETEVAYYFVKHGEKLKKNGTPGSAAMNRVKKHLETRKITNPETGKKETIQIEKESLFIKKPIYKLRKTCVWMGIGLGMSKDKVDSDLLQRFAGSSRLYACDPQDAIFIYMINKHKNAQKPEAISLDEEFEKFIKIYQKLWIKQETGKQTDTQVMSKELDKIQTDEEFESFLSSNIGNFRSVNKKILQFINNWEFDVNMPAKQIIEGTIENPEAASKLIKMIERLKENCQVITDHVQNNAILLLTRDRIIEIGLSLRMPIDKINEMLQAGGFENLYAKDIFEGYIIMRLLDIQRKSPDFFLNNNKAKEIIESEDPELLVFFEDPYDFLLDNDDIISYLKRGRSEIEEALRE